MPAKLRLAFICQRDAGNGSSCFESVDKFFTINLDTAAGLLYGGIGKMFPNSMTLAQTWNQERAWEFDAIIGNEILHEHPPNPLFRV